MNDAVAALREVDFGYADRPRIFHGLNFTLREGEQIGLYGPNGSGKTTFFRLMTGLEKPQKGGLFFHGIPVAGEADLHRLRCSIGFVVQNSDDQLFSSSVLEDVAFGPLNLGMNKKQARERAMNALSSLGIESLADRPPHKLSGGEKKLAALASVLSMQPEALLLDEPTMFLDEASREKLAYILKGQTITRIIISHDGEFLRETCTSFMRITPNGSVAVTQAFC
ncbi:MAG: ABC transporter ATP-binding protein [Mailhella sp.]|nr:ABC transporter ATP-binding protein [Mailhella sp.]